MPKVKNPLTAVRYMRIQRYVMRGYSNKDMLGDLKKSTYFKYLDTSKIKRMMRNVRNKYTSEVIDIEAKDAEKVRVECVQEIKGLNKEAYDILEDEEITIRQKLIAISIIAQNIEKIAKMSGVFVEQNIIPIENVEAINVNIISSKKDQNNLSNQNHEATA